MEATTEINIPKLDIEFVSKLFGKKVTSFEIKVGTNPGDNYNSVMYSIKGTMSDSSEIIHAISKCYPSHPTRQSHLNKSNIFWNELQIYQEFIPTLKSFQEVTGTTHLKLAFAPFISGISINFGTGKENEENIAKYSGHVFKPFDIYIMMIDMKNTYGFKMADRHVGLTVDEVSLVMAEHSKLHAISWAYKVKNGLNNIQDKFPYLKFKFDEQDLDLWANMLENNCQMAHDTLKTVVDSIEPGILDGILRLKENMKELLSQIFMEPQSATGDEAPWKVVVHADCWVNNLLFRYDPDTKKAIEVILIDLQVMQEQCPTMDLAYLIYTSTTGAFRKTHLDDMLQLYHDKFVYYCDQFNVPYLPGFSVKNLKRRFHRNKVFGLIMALMALPVILKDGKDVQDMETLKDEVDMKEMIDAVNAGAGDNVVYKKRLLEIMQDMYTDGIL